MAKVVYIEPIDYISGKIAKKHKLSFSHRKAATSNTGIPNFTSLRGPRTTKVKASEIAARTRFAEINRMKKERKADLMHQAQDQAAFKAQSQYKTFNQYLWHVCAGEYDAAKEAE